MERWHKERKGKSEKKRIAGKVDFRVVRGGEASVKEGKESWLAESRME